MAPNAIYDSRNMISTNRKPSGDFPLKIGVRTPKPSNFSYLQIGKFCVRMVFSRMVPPAISNGVVKVFLTSNPFQIFNRIVEPIRIFMIHKRLVFGVWNKGLRNEAMNALVFHRPAKPYANEQVSGRFVKYWTKTPWVFGFHKEHFAVLIDAISFLHPGYKSNHMACA